MRIRRFFAIASVALAVSLAGPAAHAVTFTFANPGADAASGGAANCDGGDVCGVAPFWTDISGLTVTATVFITDDDDNQIIQDLSPTMGGLGIVEVEENGDQEAGDNDNVDSGEGIQLHFSVPVFLEGVTFNGDHVALPDDATYRFRAGNVGLFGTRTFGNTTFPAVQVQDFYFKWGGGDPEDFYIASLDANPVPEPGTLMLVGMGLAGLAGRARKRLRG